MPYFKLSDGARLFEELAYEYGWVWGDFDWGKWMHTPEAIARRDEPGAIGRATADQLNNLLITVIPQDRFIEGELASVFDSGMLTTIVERVAAILDEIK